MIGALLIFLAEIALNSPDGSSGIAPGIPPSLQGSLNAANIPFTIVPGGSGGITTTQIGTPAMNQSQQSGLQQVQNAGLVQAINQYVASTPNAVVILPESNGHQIVVSNVGGSGLHVGPPRL